MKSNLFGILTIVLCMCVVNVTAQSIQKITLEQAIDLSIRNSRNLRVSAAKIEEASAAVQEAKDRQLPDVNVTGSYLRLGSAKIDLKNNQNGSGNGGPKVNQALYGIANLSLPLYVGGRIKYGIESARLLEKAATLNADHDRDAVIFNTMQAYTNLYKASRAAAVIRENLNASRSRDSLFSRLEQNGILARNDLLKSQLQTSNTELALMDAENNYEVANANMLIMLGLPDNTVINPDSSFISVNAENKTYPLMETMALQNRKDILALDLQKRSASIGIKSAKAQSYPSIALTGGYIAADIPKFLTITNAVNVGIGIQYNLASFWKNNTQLRIAKAREKELTAMQASLTDAVRLELNADYRNFLLAQKKIEVFDKSVVQAQENYRITKNKYDNSLVTITDLLEADVSLLQTRLNAGNARADAALAYRKLMLTTGTISNK